MKSVFILFFSVVALAGNEGSVGGDKVIRTFADGLNLALKIVEGTPSDKMSPENENETAIVAWYSEHQTDLYEDIKKSPQEWVKEESTYTLCGKTGTQRFDTLYLYKANCDRYSVADAAAHFVTESVHHFGKGDLFSARAANLIVKAFHQPGKPLTQKEKLEREAFKEVERGNVAEVKRLLDPPNSVDVNARSADGTNLVHFAIVSRALEVAKLLLERGATPDVKNDKKESALSRTQQEFFWGQPFHEMARLMIGRASDPDAARVALVENAVKLKDLDLLKVIAQGASEKAARALIVNVTYEPLWE